MFASKAHQSCSVGNLHLRQCMHPTSSITQNRCFRGARSLRVQCAGGAVLLDIRNLHAKVAGEDKQILNGVNLVIREGEIHAIMGKNGSGKSTLSKCLVGHPDYEITEGSATYRGQDLLVLEPEERARKGLFMSFQSPVEIPGVSNTEFLRLAANTRRKAQGQPELDPMEFFGFIVPKLNALKMDLKFLDRDVNTGFSGGEKKRNEILQLAVLEKFAQNVLSLYTGNWDLYYSVTTTHLQADMSILDEIDSGLDIDALREVATAVNGLRTEKTATLMVTHYQRLLNYIAPDEVHVMENGKIIYSGGIEVAGVLEHEGYEGVKKLVEKEDLAAAV